MMTREQFMELFGGNSVIYQAAEKWWKDVENCEHPYGRLWFRHWRLESRAHPQIARAFHQAFELGFADAQNTSGYFACDLFGWLYHACVERHAHEKTMGLLSGSVVEKSDADLRSVTFIEVDLPDTVLDVEIEKAVKAEISRRNARRALTITWLTPLDDIPRRLRQQETEIDLIRDKLGLVHWQKFKLKFVLLWPAAVTVRSHIPTILDGQWAFWRPAPKKDKWGRTIDLSNGGTGFREGIVAGERSEWKLVSKEDRPCRWRLSRAYDPGDGRYTELCEFLLQTNFYLTE